jgi:hypothetical protein
MSDELKEHNLLKLILIVRFASATLDMGHLYFLLFERRLLMAVEGERLEAVKGVLV